MVSADAQRAAFSPPLPTGTVPSMVFQHCPGTLSWPLLLNPGQTAALKAPAVLHMAKTWLGVLTALMKW